MHKEQQDETNFNFGCSSYHTCAVVVNINLFAFWFTTALLLEIHAIAGCLMSEASVPSGKSGFTALRTWRQLSSVLQWASMIRFFTKMRLQWVLSGISLLTWLLFYYIYRVQLKKYSPVADIINVHQVIFMLSEMFAQKYAFSKMISSSFLFASDVTSDVNFDKNRKQSSNWKKACLRNWLSRLLSNYESDWRLVLQLGVDTLNILVTVVLWIWICNIFWWHLNNVILCCIYWHIFEMQKVAR